MTLLPLLLGMGHVVGAWDFSFLSTLDAVIYDTRLRLFMPKTMDERIVIIDVDESSLSQMGRWPWNRQKMAHLVDELIKRQHVAVVGFDFVFGEADESSGLTLLENLKYNELSHVKEYGEIIDSLAPELDWDRQFANALHENPVILGFYFSTEKDSYINGVLPEPLLDISKLVVQNKGQDFAYLPSPWVGYNGNLKQLMDEAPNAGFFNALTDLDGVVRALPTVINFRHRLYESFALSVFRQYHGRPPVLFEHKHKSWQSQAGADVQSQYLSSLVLPINANSGKFTHIYVDRKLSTLIPYRGYGGKEGGSYRYISAADVYYKKLAPDALKGKIVLVGSSAPGLLDLRVTPVGATYPGVEVQANLISSFLDNKTLHIPSYVQGASILIMFTAGILLAVFVPIFSIWRTLTFFICLISAIVGLNTYVFLAHDLVFPLATSTTTLFIAYILNISYGYFVESKQKRALMDAFSTYIPPELVSKMEKTGRPLTMQAKKEELTVMFCDMRGFTKLSESADPLALQAMLNDVFSRITRIIRDTGGTIDKYMGDCVMAFWGAPMEQLDHAQRAMAAAEKIMHEVDVIDMQYVRENLPRIQFGIGINSGEMFIGDMGSDVRRSYTVLGDAVNLASRLENLTKNYHFSIIVGENTYFKAPGLMWQEIDRVQVRGRTKPQRIYTLRIPKHAQDSEKLQEELALWSAYIAARDAFNQTVATENLNKLLLNFKDSVAYSLYLIQKRRLSDVNDISHV